MSWLNKLLLCISLSCAILCLIIELWLGLTTLPIYIPIIWSIIVIITSTWFSCLLLKSTLKATSPLNIEPINKLIRVRLGIDGHSMNSIIKIVPDEFANNETNDISKFNSIDAKTDNEFTTININNFINEINVRFIDTWYCDISDEKTFENKSNEILKKLFEKLFDKFTNINELRLTHKLADVLLLHLKEYRRALKRVERGKAKDIEDAHRCLHPGSRSTSALEHTIHRLVTVIAREFLQWEMTSSLPCKLLLSILAKRLLTILQESASPQWIFARIIAILESTETNLEPKEIQNSTVSQGLSTGITSATAAVISRPLPAPIQELPPIIEITVPPERTSNTNSNRISLCLDGLSTIGHKGLWADLNDGTADFDDDDTHISPVYEEPTDFATTIARLRNLLQQKSTATTPLHTEEKSYVCDSGFMNLAIPWTEFHTSADGSQQLLYCIQFDDVEQHGEDMFETTTATVRRQYADFVQLHTSLEELPGYSGIISEIRLPDGGRTELETYLRTLCTKMTPDSPAQLRHFLRPSSGVGKKADAVAPRFDRFLAKTVTGVFNTLKTVVPGFEMDQEEDALPLPTLMPLSDIPWRFVENVKSKSLAKELKILVADRIDYCSVDTAYEAVESNEGSGDSELLAHWWETVNTPYEEELEELDGKLTMTCAIMDLICEILAGIGSNNTLRQEAVVRWTKLFLGNVTELLIKENISKGFKQLTQLSITAKDKNDYGESIEDIKKKLLVFLTSNVPGDFKIIFGDEDINKIVKFLLESLEIKKINLDLILQIVDVLASELLAACKSSNNCT